MNSNKSQKKHYENFPVASLLCPKYMRQAVVDVYHFARTADDIADEGDASATERLADLAQMREKLQSGDESRFPKKHLLDLLSAFEQDIQASEQQSWHPDMESILDYCQRSANPIGRILLHLYGVEEPAARTQSDQLCTALQLVNFWQDVSVDIPRGRYYLPLDELKKQRINALAILECKDTQASRQLVRALCEYTKRLLTESEGLDQAIYNAVRVHGWFNAWRAALEARMMRLGGFAILNKIEEAEYCVFKRRPVLNLIDRCEIFALALIT